MKPRILVIRGGAIGDFVLTLPALRLVRESFPSAHLELLGYRHIVALAEDRFYADGARSIEYGPFAAFFARGGGLDPELAEYFAGFQQVISYLYDPDGIFETNVRRAGVKNFLGAYRKLDDTDHAARQLARPLESLALYLEDPAARLHPSAADRAEAERFLAHSAGAPVIAIHPGSGSSKKNWALDRWVALSARIERERPGARLLVVGGEADGLQIDALAGKGRLVARDLPLPVLAAILERCAFFCGHDSGISHIAAAVGVRSALLFGPTDPDVWAPANEGVTVLAAADGDLSGLSVEAVWEAIRGSI